MLGDTMDELPNEARELLQLASGMHDPPSVEARLRVRRGVAAAVAAGVGASIASQAIAQGTVKTGLFTSLAAKLSGAGVALAVVSALAVTAMPAAHVEGPTKAKTSARAHRSSPRDLTVNANPVAEASPESPAQEQTVPVQAQVRPAVKKRARRAQQTVPAVAVDPLHDETVLLIRAASAIDQGAMQEAERALAQHAARFHASALREERDGLRALMRCTQDPARAKREGALFVKRAPESVLAQRVMRACGLPGMP